MRTCIIRGCGKPVPPLKVKELPRWLCEEHHAPVSDAAVAGWTRHLLMRQAVSTWLKLLALRHSAA